MATIPTNNIFGGAQVVNKQQVPPASSANIFGGPGQKSYTPTSTGNIFGGPTAVVRPRVDAPPVVVKPTVVPPKTKNPLMAIGESIDQATARPDYEKKPASTSKWKNALREYPAALIETILPGVKVMRDMPEEFTDIKPIDLLKEVPGATGEVARNIAASTLSYPLTFYGATSQYATEKIGLGKAPGVSEDGRVRVKVPILGDVTNIQERIFTDKEGKAPASNIRTGVDVARYAGEEILNGLFTASIASNIVNPRIVPITAKGRVNVPKGSTQNTGHKSFRLYEPQVMKAPIDNKTFQKITTENKIVVNGKYNPKNPVYFEYTGTSGNTLKGRFVQVKDSYVKTFINTFKGDPTKVPVNQLIPVAETAKDMALLASRVTAPTPVIPTIKPVVDNIFQKPVAKPTVPPAVTPTVAPVTKQQVEVSRTEPTVGDIVSVKSINAPQGVGRYTIEKFYPDNVVSLKDVETGKTKNVNIKSIRPTQEPVPISKPKTEVAVVKPKVEAPVVKPKAKPTADLTLAPSKVTEVKVGDVYGDKIVKDIFKNKSTQFVTVKKGNGSSTQSMKDFIEEIQNKSVGFEGPAPKTLINKTDIKTLVANSPEFKANPTLVVDADKNLTFKGKNQEIKIKSSALGLNEENLTAGDEISVDVDSLKAQKTSQQMRVYKGGKSYASIGKFRDGTPLLQGGTENVKPIELPEMVQLAKDLMGEAPKIRTKVSRRIGTQGIFKPVGNGKISLRADLFNPEVSSIDQAAKTLAHEIGHLVDYLPEGTLKRGNLVGRLNTLKEFRKDLFEPMGITRSDSEFRKQLWELSQYWRPIAVDNASPSFLEYRKSAAELYADFLSVLLNDPKLAQKMAPSAYNVFFEQLDKKPAVRDAYFELQSLLSGDPSTLTAARRAGVKQMFKEGDYKAAELQAREEAEKKLRLSSLYERVKFDLVSKNYPVINKIKELEKKGVVIKPDDNPVYYLEEKNYLGGRIKAIMAQDFDPVYRSLNASGLSWDDFGEALFYKRIIDGDRSKVANPRGITVDVAKKLYEDLRNKLGDKLPVLDESLKGFQEALMKRADEAYNEGLYSEEMYNDMKKNPTYATFQVLDYIENGLTSKVYKSIGTLKDITNPATASMEKMIKTVQAVEQNRANTKMVDFLNTNFPDEIKPATKVFSGKGQRFLESKKDNEELVTLLRKGKLEGYYVDPYIAKSLTNESIGSNLAAVQALRFMNSNLYRPLFITYSLGFQSFNLIRDFFRFYKNMPDTGYFESLNLYRKSLRAAKIRAFGLPDNPTPADIEANKLIESLEMQKILSVTMNDLLIGKGGDETQIELLLDKYGVNPKEEDKNVVRKILEFVRQTGDLIETIPKVAGYRKLTTPKREKGQSLESYILSPKREITKADASFIRRNIGSPDFQDGGYAKPISNEVFLFSNSIIQGIRSDLEIATNPKTRSGYWYKTAKVNFIPKILMWLASIGLAGSAVKEMMDDVSEYDKTNYTIIPLGRDENNKTVYLRIPQDETGRLLSAILWKTMNMSNNDQSVGKDAGDIISLLGGQIPGVTPTIGLISTTAQYLSGKNPYDYFRGRNVMSDDVFAAGGAESAKAFWGWQFQQIGGGIFGNLFNGSKTPVDKSIPEKIITFPVASNILNRFIKVSNYGRTEMFNQIQDNYAQVDAKRRLEEKDIAREYADKVVKGEMTAVEANNKMLTERFGGEPENDDQYKEAQRLQNRLHLNLMLGKQDPVVNALIYARQNEEKAAILSKAKETMEISVFKALVESMYSDKIINDEVIYDLQEMLNNK